MTRIVVSGTDTGIGKTVFSAGLAGFLGGRYWKPVQAGLDDETDSAAVARLAGLAEDAVLPEAYRLATPASPHLAARLDGIVIDAARLDPPADDPDRPLVIEGAGGLMVPLTEDMLLIDLFARWGLPLVLCARSGLGTLNHTLLSLEALRRRGIAVLGVALIGPPHGENARIIARLGAVKVLGTLPPLDPLAPAPSPPPSPRGSAAWISSPPAPGHRSFLKSRTGRGGSHAAGLFRCPGAGNPAPRHRPCSLSLLRPRKPRSCPQPPNVPTVSESLRQNLMASCGRVLQSPCGSAAPRRCPPHRQRRAPGGGPEPLAPRPPEVSSEAVNAIDPGLRAVPRGLDQRPMSPTHGPLV